MAKLIETTHRFLRGWHLFKAGAWTLFGLAGPLLFLLMRNYLGVALLGAISAVLGLFLFGPKQADFKGRKALRTILVTQGVLFGAYGTYVLTLPSAPWVYEAGGTRVGLALDPERGRVYAVEFTEVDADFLVHTPGETTWQAESFPGRFVVRIGLLENGTVLAHEDRSAALFIRPPDTTWREAVGPGSPSAYATSTTGTFAAASGELVRFDPEGTPTEVPNVGPITTVCAQGPSVFAIRSANVAAPSQGAWRSEDGGITFTSLPTLHLPATHCALSADGTTWIANSGVFRGEIAVGRGTTFTTSTAPAPRIEALVANPSDGNEAWIATWGAGVYRTRDRGRTWQSMGLLGSEVSDLVIDFRRRTAYASTGSGIQSRTF